MKTAEQVLLAVLVVAALVLAWRLSTTSTRLDSQEQEVRGLATELASTSKRSTLDLQEKCAGQAERFFKAGVMPGDKEHPLRDYTSHYNSAVDRCFVEISEVLFDAVLKEEEGQRTRTLYDAYERTKLAELIVSRDGQTARGCHILGEHGALTECPATPQELQGNNRAFLRGQTAQYETFVAHYVK